MIKFFRRIRQSLLSEGKMSAYILYAIGEIVLVVVGILIAIQIDDWNQLKIDRNAEFDLLTQIRSDLVANQAEVDLIKKGMSVSMPIADSLIKSLDRRKRVKYFNAYVSIIHKKETFNNSSSGYASLQGGLFYLIKDNILRNNISSLYESDFANIDEREKEMFYHIDQVLNPQTYRLFDINTNTTIRLPSFDDNSFDLYTPLDFNTLSNNLEYKNTIKVLKKMYAVRLNALKKTEEKLEQTISLLDERLNKL